MPKPRTHSRASQPAFLTNARAFYGQAFDHKSSKGIARSMGEWAELDEDEQSFAQAHLAFLNLQAQATTQRLLVQVRDLLDEVADSLSAVLERFDEEEDEDLLADFPEPSAAPEPEVPLPPEPGPVEEEPVEDAADDEGGEA
jgi:hypothetical protein